MRDHSSSPAGLRGSGARVFFPEGDGTNRSPRRGSVNQGPPGRIYVDGGASPQASHVHLNGNYQRQGETSRHFASILKFVQADDGLSLRRLLSKISPADRELVFSTTINKRNLVMIAVERGDLAVLQSILEWLLDKQVGEVLMKKDEDNGRTILMRAASTGEPDVLKLVASRLLGVQVLELLMQQCTEGNSVVAYAVETGKSAVVEAVLDLFPPCQVADVLRMKNLAGETPLMQAAGAPNPGAFEVVAKMLTTTELASQLECRNAYGRTALIIATSVGSASTWKAVASKMDTGMVNYQLTSIDHNGDTAVVMSIRSDSAAVFESVVGCLTKDQTLRLLGTRTRKGQTPAQVAIECGAEAVFIAMMRPEWISACALDAPDESEAQLTALDLAVRPPVKLAVVKCLLACGATPTSRVVQKLLRICSSDGGAVAGNGMATVRDCFLGAIAASNWARNPLIPGMNLYVAIVAARRTSPYFKNSLEELRDEVGTLVLSVLKHLPDRVEGFDRFWDSAQGVKRQSPAKPPTGHAEVGKSALLSTIARGVSASNMRLEDTPSSQGTPKTSGGGISLVQEMLEPELAGLQPRNCAGPLAQAMQCRFVDFIDTPLVHHYLRLKFSGGLPNPIRENNWHREKGRVDKNLNRFMLDQDETKLTVYILQGGCTDSPSWTYMPGLQFILAGVAGKTGAYFGVPAMRLALDVLVYVGVVIVYVTKVVVLQDVGTITLWESLWLLYLIGAIWKQIREVQEAGSIRVHLFNPWNLVEVTSLATITTGVIFRVWAYMCYSHGEHVCGKALASWASVSSMTEIYLAQYFQAASAPFVLGKVLFLTQIHSSLGPLMHSTFKMMGDMVRFGALMLVVTLGFALGFYAMFGSISAALPEGSNIAGYDTYYSSLLTLFASMLGNFDFEVFNGAPLGIAGVILLAFFLCVMNIMLLNLLIAILTTSHAKVERNADKEAVLSEAVIITQYRRALRLDSLPSPLNVPQELISHIFWRHKERSKELFARGIFWCVSGPISISVTAILWVLSLPLTLAWTGRVVKSSGSIMLVPALIGISFNLGLAPLVTTWLWLRGVVDVWQQGHETMSTSDSNEIEVSRAHRRGTYVTSPVTPLASVALAAVAAKKVIISADAMDNHELRMKHGVSPHSSPSNLWQQAAQVGGAGGYYFQKKGFNVVAAIHEFYGATMLQLKEGLEDGRVPRSLEQGKILRLDSLGNKMRSGKHQRDQGCPDALAQLNNRQDRLEELIRQADESRRRMETKLDQVVKALGGSSDGASGRVKGHRTSNNNTRHGNSIGVGVDDSNSNGNDGRKSTVATHERLEKGSAPPSAVCRGDGKVTLPVLSTQKSKRGSGGGGRGGGGGDGELQDVGKDHARPRETEILASDRRRRNSNAAVDIDDFINNYHAGVRDC